MVDLAHTLAFEMVVQRCHQENALAGKLERSHLQNDRQGFHNEQAAGDCQHQFMPRGHRHRPQGTAKRQ